MFRVLEETAKITPLGGGMERCNAELKIEAWEDGISAGCFYVHAAILNREVYTLSERSMLEYMDNMTAGISGSVEFLEEYDNFRDTRRSAYAKAFEIAKRLLDDLKFY